MAHCELWGKTMNTVCSGVYVAALLGLGDAIVFKPILAQLSTLHDHIYWPARQSNLHTIQALFADLKNVTVLEFEDENWEKSWLAQHHVSVLNLRKITQESSIWYRDWPQPAPAAVRWDRQLYEHFDLPFSMRYSQWRAQFDRESARKLFDQLNPAGEPYLLWHNSTSYAEAVSAVDLISWRNSQNLPPLKIVMVEPIAQNLLDWYLLIEQAQEIHCVPSSFYCLVDSLHNRTKAHLYYHDVRHNAVLQVNCNANNHRWTVVSYNLRI